jgi:hypothetical protein
MHEQSLLGIFRAKAKLSGNAVTQSDALASLQHGKLAWFNYEQTFFA